MAINFPSSPTIGLTTTTGSKTWEWTGEGWKLQSVNVGIVTSITAGSGISVNQSTGNVTITATGAGGGADINEVMLFG